MPAFKCVWLASVAKEKVKIRAPVANEKLPAGYEMQELEVLDPMSVVRYMFLESGLELPMQDVHQYWDHLRAFGHPFALNASASRDHIPLGLFGDGVKFRQLSFGRPQKMVGVFLNCPLWRPKWSRASRWLLFAIREDHLTTAVYPGTLDAVYHHIVWSLNCLHDGHCPRTGAYGEPLPEKHQQRAGKPICQGRRFCVTEIRADWLYHKQLLRFRSSWLGGVKAPVCFLCPAFSSGADTWLNVEDSSPLWTKQYSVAEFLTEQCPPNPSALPQRRNPIGHFVVRGWV